MRAPALLRPLAHREFALLWSGQSLSILGNFVNGVALPWQVLQLTGSAVQMGIVVAVNIAASAVFLLFGGVIVDRLPRRRVLLVSDLADGVVLAGIAALSAVGALRIEHLYVSAAVTGALGAFFAPAITAILPELVPEEVLVSANALRGLSRQGGRMLGPVIGGLLVATSGPALAFAFDAATFFGSFVALVAMRDAATPTAAPRSGFVRELREGLAFVATLPWLWVTIALFGVVNAFLVGANAVGLPVLLREVLGVDAATFGLVYASQGVGEALGGLWLGQVRVRRAGPVMYAFAAVGGISLLLLATAMLPLVFLASVIWGLSFVGFGVLWESALQRHVPRALLGRVSSVDWFGSIVLSPAGPLAAGALVASFGPAPVFVAGGLVMVAGCGLALLVPSIRTLA